MSGQASARQVQIAKHPKADINAEMERRMPVAIGFLDPGLFLTRRYPYHDSGRKGPQEAVHEKK